MHRACLTSICNSWREIWTDAYDALVDAAAASVREPGCTVTLTDLHRCLDACSESCDRAEGLVQAAAASRHDELCHAVRAADKDLQAVSADREENEMEEEKNRPPTTPLAAKDKYPNRSTSSHVEMNETVTERRDGLGYFTSPCRMVAEMRQPHALF